MIGQVFMKNFYTVFEYDDREILLAGNAHNSWSVDIAAENGVDYSSDDEDSLPTIDIIMIVLATVLFLTFGIFVCVKCNSSGKNAEMADNDVQQNLYGQTTSGVDGERVGDGEM
jgi:hypothetical protein